MRVIVLLVSFACYLASPADPTLIQQGIDAGTTLATGQQWFTHRRRWVFVPRRRFTSFGNFDIRRRAPITFHCFQTPSMPLPPFMIATGLNQIAFELCAGTTYGTRLSAKVTGTLSPWSVSGWLLWSKNVVEPDWNDPFADDNVPVLGLTVCYTVSLNKLQRQGEDLTLKCPLTDVGVSVTVSIDFTVCAAFAIELEHTTPDIWLMASGGPTFSIGFPGITLSSTGRIYGHWILKDCQFTGTGTDTELTWDRIESVPFWEVQLLFNNQAFVTMRGPIPNTAGGILQVAETEYANLQSAVTNQVSAGLGAVSSSVHSTGSAIGSAIYYYVR